MGRHLVNADTPQFNKKLSLAGRGDLQSRVLEMKRFLVLKGALRSA
jgi:hypothetical protein